MSKLTLMMLLLVSPLVGEESADNIADNILMDIVSNAQNDLAESSDPYRQEWLRIEIELHRSIMATEDKLVKHTWAKQILYINNIPNEGKIRILRDDGVDIPKEMVDKSREYNKHMEILNGEIEKVLPN